MTELVSGMIQRRDFVLAIRDVSSKLAQLPETSPALKQTLMDLAYNADILDAVLLRMSMEAKSKEKGSDDKKKIIT